MKLYGDWICAKKEHGRSKITWEKVERKTNYLLESILTQRKVEQNGIVRSVKVIPTS